MPSTQRNKPRAPLQHALSCLVISIGAAVLAGCGGGGGADPATPAAAGASGQKEAKSAANASDAIAVSPYTDISQVRPIPPTDPTWAKVHDVSAPCTTDKQFVAVTSAVGNGSETFTAPLLSRHASCAVMITNVQTLQIYLQEDANGKKVLCKTLNATGCTAYDAGRVKLHTKVQIWGTNKALAKNYTIETVVASWTKLLPSLPDNLTLTLDPNFSCEVIQLHTGTKATCSVPNEPGPQDLGLTAPRLPKTWTVNPTFAIGIPKDGEPSAALYRFKLDSYQYKFTQATAPKGGTRMDAWGPEGQYFEPDIRCDKNMAAGTNSGCVLPGASAVYVIDSGNQAISEYAAHVRESLSLTPADLPARGMTALPPGRFYAMRPYTQAVVSVPVSSPEYEPLFYLRDRTLTGLNRDFNCKDPTGQINSRPFNATPACTPDPKTAGCSCDEYPFASTLNGAVSTPGNAGLISLKWINGQHNSNGGPDWQGFLNKERVWAFQPGGAAADPVWVVVK